GLVEGRMAALFATSDVPLVAAEVTIPDVPFQTLIATSLLPNTMYELQATGPNIASSASTEPPGTSVRSIQVRTNENGVLRLETPGLGNVRLRITTVSSSAPGAAPAR